MLLAILLKVLYKKLFHHFLKPLLGKRVEGKVVGSGAFISVDKIEAFSRLVAQERGNTLFFGLVGIGEDARCEAGDGSGMGEITVVHRGVDKVDGAVETDFVKVVVAAAVVQIKQAAVGKNRGLRIVRQFLPREILQYGAFGGIVVGEKVKLLALRDGLRCGRQAVVFPV